MKNWNKTNVPKEVVRELCAKYGMEPLVAAIMVRRGITSGAELQYFLETDKRFLHSPFLFSAMSDVVERIMQAADEGENVLVFGDRDVDGVTSTTVLFDALTALGIKVTWRLPSGNDCYGLSITAVDEFAAAYGTLIITVDCGISNNREIAHAASLGIDVIILDHHNPPPVLPAPAIILNPKCAGSGYPFPDISGCAVAFKVAQALRFAQCELYKQEICLLAVRPVNEAYTIDCIKLENLVQTGTLSETIIPGALSISQTRLLPFLRGQQIFVWDGALTKKMLATVFGTGVEFNMLDIRPEVAKVIPAVADMSLVRLKGLSRIARYNPDAATEIAGFYNIFVTFMEKKLAAQNPANAVAEERDLQLVALAALADIMPLLDENRILLHHGIASLNAGKAREGLVELLSKTEVLGKRITSTDLSWQVAPALNSAGRLGTPETACQLFLEQDATRRDALAAHIISLNRKRKQLGSEAWQYAQGSAEDSIARYSDKLCVVYDERIHRGVSGLLAGRLVQRYNVPAIVMTAVDGIVIGSMRSCRGYDVTGFLGRMGDIFINHGGHNFAAGFSLKRERIDEFMELLAVHAPLIELDADTSETLVIDAELPAAYLAKKLADGSPYVLGVLDTFEPYGEANRELLFMTRGLPIFDAQITGKTERQHLKLVLNCAGTKWPALFWGEAERLHRDFDKGDCVDVVYMVGRNVFNGVETPQLILKDVRRTQQA